jgi:hypothetical protein
VRHTVFRDLERCLRAADDECIGGDHNRDKSGHAGTMLLHRSARKAAYREHAPGAVCRGCIHQRGTPSRKHGKLARVERIAQAVARELAHAVTGEGRRLRQKAAQRLPLCELRDADQRLRERIGEDRVRIGEPSPWIFAERRGGALDRAQCVGMLAHEVEHSRVLRALAGTQHCECHVSASLRHRRERAPARRPLRNRESSSASFACSA